MNTFSESVLIVGASRGLGLGLAKGFIELGWRVVATVRNAESAVDLRNLATAEQLEIECVDIRDQDQVTSLSNRLSNRIFDIVFVCAGILGPLHQRAEKATQDEICEIFYVNAIAPIALARLFAERVRPNTGILGFMSSWMGSVTLNVNGNFELYRASKAALNSLSRSLAAELRKLPITLISLHPGGVRTDMGGPNANLDVPTSVRGLIEVMMEKRKTFQHGFFDYKGEELPW